MSEIELWNEMGKLYFNSGSSEDAIGVYKKAIELDRGYGWSYANLASAYVHEGRYAEAIPLYQKSIELLIDDKDKAISWNRLGETYRLMYDFDRAIAAYQRAVELDPEDVTFRKDLAEISYDQGWNENVSITVHNNSVDKSMKDSSGPDKPWMNNAVFEKDPMAQESPGPAGYQPATGEKETLEAELTGQESYFAAWLEKHSDNGQEKNISRTSQDDDMAQGTLDRIRTPSGKQNHYRLIIRSLHYKKSKNPKHPDSSAKRMLLVLGDTNRLRRKTRVPEEITGHSVPVLKESILQVEETSTHETLPSGEGGYPGDIYEDRSMEPTPFASSGSSQSPGRLGEFFEGEPKTPLTPLVSNPAIVDTTPRKIYKPQSSIEGDQEYEAACWVFGVDSSMTDETRSAEEECLPEMVTCEPDLEPPLLLVEPSDELALAEVDTSSNAVLPEAINNSPQDDKEHDPKDTFNGIESNQANKDTQRVAEDIATYKKVTEINPRNAFAWDTLGNLYKTSGSYREAVTSFEQAVSLDPNKALYRYNLGLVYAIQQRYDEAIGAFEKVVEFDPGNRLAHATLAGYYRRLGQDAEAKKHITIALSTMKDENEYNRACFEAICGNADQAIELLKVALEQKQTSLDWARRDPDLDFIREDPRYKALVNAEVGVSS